MPANRKPITLVAFGALGVVFGDIGTSPLYAVRQLFHDDPDFAHDPNAILGFLSLVLWSIVLVVCVKYAGFVLRADHDGEGGTLAMLGLIHARSEPSQNQSRDETEPKNGQGAGRQAGQTRKGNSGTQSEPAGTTAMQTPGGDADGTQPAVHAPPGGYAGKRAQGRARPKPGRRARPDALTLVALFASALLFGDGMVTPAISVLSAVEGLKVATPIFQPVVLPLAVAILGGLFALQSGGTQRVAKLFGPVMLAWFAAIGVIGLLATIHHPAVLAAFDPRHAASFLIGHGWKGFSALGVVVLAFSGVEALFADLGQFGRRPITLAWYCVVLPGLLLNYLGQGGHVLDDPSVGSEPFFSLVPHWAIYPMVALSTAAAVIASQALISGMFSLTQQAVNMGYAPRYGIRHTAADAEGQVYMPVVNGALALGCIAIVLAFRSSDALGSAYGLAVIGTMTITSVVYFVVLRRVWGWSLAAAVPLVGSFLIFEAAFLVANFAKLLSGAWVPLAIALVVFAVMAVWTDCRARYHRAVAGWGMPVSQFRNLMRPGLNRNDETAVFLTGDLDTVPLVGRNELVRANACEKRILLLKVENTDQPSVPQHDRVEVEGFGENVLRATARFGFMETASVCDVLPEILPDDWKNPVFYLPQPVVAERGGMIARWRCRLFLFLGNTGLSPAEFLHIPPEQTLSIRLEVEL